MIYKVFLFVHDRSILISFPRPHRAHHLKTRLNIVRTVGSMLQIPSTTQWEWSASFCLPAKITIVEKYSHHASIIRIRYSLSIIIRAPKPDLSSWVPGSHSLEIRKVWFIRSEDMCKGRKVPVHYTSCLMLNRNIVLYQDQSPEDLRSRKISWDTESARTSLQVATVLKERQVNQAKISI